MNFIETSRQYYNLFNGWVGISFTKFDIKEELPSDLRILINDFVHSPQDFDFAKKSVNMENDVFGPYTIEKLTIDDYQIIEYEKLLKKSHHVLSDIGEDGLQKKEYIDFMSKVSNLFTQFDNKDYSIFILNPTEEKLAEFSPFHVNCYFCSFCIDTKNKTLEIINIDDD